jgi:hypothetical protein
MSAAYSIVPRTGFLVYAAPSSGIQSCDFSSWANTSVLAGTMAGEGCRPFGEPFSSGSRVPLLDSLCAIVYK